jgi:hypothetical protein
MIKVVRNDHKTFGEIEIGTFFFVMYDDTYTDYETIYQKTITVTDPESCENVNAVVVVGDETGNIVCCEDNEEVVPIHDAKFVIEN